MAYVSLYRKFRPDTFDKVVEQNHIVKTLINQIKRDKIGHAYLFTGTRGTGKTSCAKIFAKAVNCLSPVNGSPCGICQNCVELSKPSSIDIVEMDAASNNGVDEIRQLKENVQYRPATGKYKVYIIDEVHMLSASAFNALLKTLEEPPPFVIFILATTEVQKLPATILSRCMRFDFRLVSTEGITSLLKRIFAESGIEYENDALLQIALHGEGSVRDALSIAEMCVSYADSTVTLDAVNDVLGASDFASLHALGTAILRGETGNALTILEKLYKEGRSSLHRDLSNYFCNLLSVKNVKDTLTAAGDKEKILLKENINFDNYRINRALEIIAGIETELRYSSQPRLLMEAAVARASELRLDESVDGLVSRLKSLEEKLRSLQETQNFQMSAKGKKAEKTETPLIEKQNSHEPSSNELQNSSEPSSNEPQNSSEPLALNESQNSHKPVALNEPQNSHKPVALNEPQNSHKPVALKEPQNSHKPVALKEPPLTHEPFSNEPPLTHEPFSMDKSSLSKVNVDLLFEEIDSDNAKAERLWDNAIKRLYASNKKMIATACNDVTEVKLEGNTFTAVCTQSYVFKLISSQGYVNAVRAALAEELPEVDYRVELKKEKDITESIRILEELSGGKLIKK